MGGIRFEPDGTVTLITGTLDYGQGHAAPFAQVLSERLGIPFDRIRLIQGDSDELVFGGGTGGSRSITATGTAIVEASDEVIERGRKIAGFVLEAAETDIEFAAGRFVIAGTDRSIGILELAQQIRDGLKLPQGLPQSLDVKQTTKDVIPSTFPNGCHVAEVEIDPETGVIEVVKYAAVNDFGTIVNPMLVEDRLRRRGPIAERILHGLRAAAGIRRAVLHHRKPSGAGEIQSARDQRLRRGRLRRRAHLGDERGCRRAIGIRHRARRHAAHARSGVAGDRTGEGEAERVK